MKFPQVLYKVISELVMGLPVPDFSMHFKEYQDSVCLMMNRYRCSIVVKVIVCHLTSLTLYDHVMQDHTCCHDLLQCLFVSIHNRSTDICKASSQHPNALNILSRGFLTQCKVRSLVAFLAWNCFHKCGPWAVDAIVITLARSRDHDTG